MPKRKYSRKSNVYWSMARKKPRRSYTTKRKSFRKRKSRPTTLSLRQVGLGFPERIRVKLRYSQLVSLAWTSGSSTWNIFRGASLFDPDLSGAGAQPMWFDQYAAIYGFYRVFGSSIKVDPIPPASGYESIDCWLIPSASQSSFVGIPHDTLTEQPYARFKRMQLATRSPMLKAYMATAKLYGDVKARLKYDTSYESAVTTSPSNGFYWHVGIAPSDQSSTGSAAVHVTITYYVEFNARARPTGS